MAEAGETAATVAPAAGDAVAATPTAEPAPAAVDVEPAAAAAPAAPAAPAAEAQPPAGADEAAADSAGGGSGGGGGGGGGDGDDVAPVAAAGGEEGGGGGAGAAAAEAAAAAPAESAAGAAAAGAPAESSASAGAGEEDGAAAAAAATAAAAAGGATAAGHRTVSDFTFGRELGQGAYGAVVLGKENATGKQYAVKMLEKAHLIREKKVKYATTERDILTLCGDHPNVVQLSYTFKDDTYLYYVMELCSNGELLGQMKHHGTFDGRGAAFYAAEIVNALEYLHSKNVIHRDLKPENVLLDDRMHVKVTDFGTAKVVGAEPGARSGSFVGTAEYVSPELLNEKVTYKASDLWALGAIVYQMICGRPPFQGNSDFLIFQKVGAAKFEFPTGFPDNARDLVSRLLVVDPMARLGADGNYDALRAHAFFTENGIAAGDWAQLHRADAPVLRPYPTPLVFPEDVAADEEAKRKEMLGSDQWAKFLHEGEVILEAGLVLKRRGRSVKKRQLILTNTPRIIYIDVKKMVQKGEVAWSTNIRPEAKNNTAWFIHTPKRTYILEDIPGNAQRWVDAINKQLELSLARKR